MTTISELFPDRDNQEEEEQRQLGGQANLVDIFPERQTQAAVQQQREDLAAIPEIGNAPELNRLNMPAFTASYGLLVSRSDDESKKVLKKQFPDVTFEDTAQGVIAKLPSGEYFVNKKGLSGQDIAQFAMDALAFTPAGRAKSIGGAALGSGLTELGLQATGELAGGGGIDAEDALLSALLGGGFKAAEQGVTAGIQAFRGGTGASPETQLVQQAQKANIPLMTSDVMEPQTFASRMALQTGEKVPLAGTGGLREAQQAAREEAAQEFINQYGTASYQTIIDSLKTKKKSVLKSAGNALERTAAKLDPLGEIPMTRTMQAINEVERELTKKGVIRSNPAIAQLDELVEAITSGPQSFSSLKENRTAFNDLISGFDSTERSQLGSRANALLQRVKAGMTDDMTMFAKNNLDANSFRQWKRANAAYAEEATKLKSTRLKNILDRGDVTPESAQTMLFSQKKSELQNLYRSLTNEGRAAARAAIIDKIVTNTSRRASGFTPNAFASELAKFDSQIGTFFKGEERRQLKGLQRVLNATRRAQEAGITTPTGQVTLGAGTGLAAFIVPVETGISGATLGLASRIYESRAVRNALIALAETPPSSSNYQNIVRQAQIALNAAAQNQLRREEEL